MDGGAWKAAVYGVAEGWTQLSDFTFTFHFHALRRKWQPAPVLLPGESQGRGSLVGCRLWGRTESDMTCTDTSIVSLQADSVQLAELFHRSLKGHLDSYFKLCS